MAIIDIKPPADRYKAIADAIRKKTDTEELMRPEDMPRAILDIVGGTSLNIAYGETPPEDTSKLWIKANEPDKITFKKEVEGAESINLLDAHLPSAYYGMGCASVGSKIYLFGGYNNSGRYNAIRVLDTETETLTTLTTVLPTAREGIACARVGTKIYLFGGKTKHSTTGFLSEICVFDTETETITTLSATLPNKCSEISCARVGTKIYLFGGKNYSSAYDDICVFDTETETITTLSVTLSNNYYGTGCASFGTKVYLLGGHSSNAIMVFDTETEAITKLSVTLPDNCYSMGCVIIGKKIYLLGGASLDTINVFDTETEIVETLNTTLPQTCQYMGCGGIGNKIYLFGGVVGSYNYYLNTITKFTLTSELQQGNIELQTSFLNNVFKLINTKNAQVEIGIENVYIGNENNEAELCEAYLHNGSEWVQI